MSVRISINRVVIHTPDTGRRFLVCHGTVRGTPDNPRLNAVCGVGGQLKSNDASARKVVGKTVKFTHGGTHARRPMNAVGRGTTDTDRSDARWVIVFDLPDDQPGVRSTLTVHGLVCEGGTPPDPGIKQVDVPDAKKGGNTLAPVTINIIDPPQGARNEVEAEFFVATGSVLQDHRAVAATMNGIDAEYLSTEDQVWCAVFPPLQSLDGDSLPIGYTLVVADNVTHTHSRAYYFS